MANLNVSRLGQIEKTGAADALWLTQFSGEILATYNKKCIYKDKHRVRTIHNGQSAQFPAIGRISADYRDPGTQLTGTPIAHNQRVITVDGFLSANVAIADIDELKNHYDVGAPYSRQMGDALAQVYDRNIARVAILAARSAPTLAGEQGGSVITGAATVGTNAMEFKKALFACAQTLDEKNVPTDRRWALVSPVTYYVAAQEPHLINKDWDGDGSMSNGFIGSLAGIAIAKTNNIPNSNELAAADVLPKYRGDFSKTVFHVMQEEAVGTVQLMDLSVESEYQIMYQSTLMVAKYAVGHGILRPECAIEVVKP